MVAIMSEIVRRVPWRMRNGRKTGVSRRKRQSAIDMAILAIRAEERSPDAKAIVMSLKDRILKTEI